MNLTCYIADDETHAIEILTDYVSRTPGLTLTGSSSSSPQALNDVNLSPPAIIFLDIDMPELDGLHFAALINRKIKVIFITSYREYGPEAFEHNAAGYLLKPISYDRFLASVQKIRLGLPVSEKENLGEEFLFIKSGIKGQMLRISIREISFINGADNYIEFHIKGKKMIGYLTLTEVQERLPRSFFSRVHNSYIINHNFIHSIEYAQVRMESGDQIPIGRAYRETFFLKINSSFLVSKRDHSG